jgi:hypothetical protein
MAPNAPAGFLRCLLDYGGDRAAKIIQDALGTENDDITNYVFPKTWPADRVQPARIIGERLQTEVQFLA